MSAAATWRRSPPSMQAIESAWPGRPATSSSSARERNGGAQDKEMTRGNEQTITFYWNGRPVSARQGDTVAAALWRAGITTLARSRKIHRPLGYSGSYPTGVLARVNGRPNVRLDQVRVEDGLTVEMQNTWPSPRFDLLKFAQVLPPKAVYGGFEHGGWMPQAGLAHRLAERAMANLAGVARPADITGQPLAIPG